MIKLTGVMLGIALTVLGVAPSVSSATPECAMKAEYALVFVNERGMPIRFFVNKDDLNNYLVTTKRVWKKEWIIMKGKMCASEHYIPEGKS